MAEQVVPLSVVMPVYNEEAAIADAIEDVRRDVLTVVPDAELVVVNDGSRDSTATLLDAAAAADPRIRPVHQGNRGHGGALLTGLAAARGDVLFLIDSDRQIALDRFPAAWQEITRGRDAVFGVRRRRYDPALRLYLSKAIRHTVNTLFGVGLTDANVPYKLFRRRVWDAVRRDIPADSLAPSLFLAILAARGGFGIVELDVVHKERDTGEVSIRRFKLLKFCARGLSQLLALRRRVSASSSDGH